MQIVVKHDLAKLRKQLRRYPKSLLFAQKLALDATAQDVKKVEDTATKRYLDRPVPFTQRLTLVRKAHTRNLTAVVFVPDRKEQYMQYHIRGGTEIPKGGAFAVPVNARLNKYGNVVKGSRAGAVLRKSDKFFSGTVNGTPGVWQRFGRGGKSLRLHSVYKKSLSYRKRFPFEMLAVRTVSRVIAKHADREIRKQFAFIDNS